MFKIRNKSISNNSRCYITFEAGPTHRGYKSAKKLIKYAAQAGADAIKFQILDAERLIQDKNQMFEFKILIDKNKNKTKTVKKKLYDLIKERSLKKTEWAKLRKYAEKFNIAFFATIAFEDEINFVKSIGCDSIKIASADLNYLSLIDKASKTKLPIQLDTGMSSIEEVEKAVKIIEKNNNKKIIIHHCPSGYPAGRQSINLNIIKTLKKKFKYPIAFSDHSPGYDVDIAALAMGSNMLEKTITENVSYPSVEHMMSIEKKDMFKFVSTVRFIEDAMGSYKRTLYKEEIIKRNKVRRSLFVSRPVKKNEVLKKVPHFFARPGNGITPELFEKVKNFKLRKNLLNNSKVKIKDLKKK